MIELIADLFISLDGFTSGTNEAPWFGYFGHDLGSSVREHLDGRQVTLMAHLGKLGRAAIDEYSPQFPLRLMNQNFGLILHLARIKDAHMAVTEAAYEASKPALPTEGDEDFSAMVRYMERLNVGSNSARSVLDGRQPASR